MARLYQRGKTWYIDYIVGGTRVRKKSGTSKKLADLMRSDIEIQIAKGDLTFLPKDKQINLFFEDYKRFSKTNHSPATHYRYSAIIENFKRFIEKQYPTVTKLSQLRPIIFEEFKTCRKEQGAKDNTVNMELTTIRTIFKYAIKINCLRKDPVEGVAYLKVHDAKTPRFLTKEEIKKFLDNTPKQYYPIFLTFFYTGMRSNELLHLQWMDIDFNTKKILIRQKADWHPKSSNREIPIHPNLEDLLKKIKSRNTKPEDKVFHVFTEYKRPGDELRKLLIKIAKKAGLKELTKIHSLRHTFASLLVAEGVPIPTLQRLLGHADFSTTMIYSHLAPDHISDSIKKINI